MSLPTPTNREEIYLNAIANGITNGLPTPVTRTEMFLAYIAENGGGGSAVTKEYVDTQDNKKTDLTNIATVETSNVASKDYSKDELLVYNNQLYKAKTAIEVEDILTVDINIEATTMSDYIGGSITSILNNSY